MGLKCLNFTDGSKICVFSGNNSLWDDTVRVLSGDMLVYTLNNAFLTCGKSGGGIANESLIGKTLTDAGGNVWTFAMSGNDLVVTVDNPNTSFHHSETLGWSRTGRDDGMNIWLLTCPSINQDGSYNLSFQRFSPVLANTRSTEGSTVYMRVGYLNGVNGGFTYVNDASMLGVLHDSPSDFRMPRSQLRNLIPSGPFISVTGCATQNTEDIVESGKQFYATPFNNSSGGSSTFVTVSQDSITDYVPVEDPYDPGGSSGPGGGGGTFDDGSDIIGLPPLPTMSFASTGFTRIYNPTLSQLNDLANYLWTDTTFLQTVINHLKQLLENPMDAIISLSLVPCPVPNGSPIPVKVMYIDTGVSMAPATTQFVDVDCGTLTVQEYYGSALDYNPYTKIHCYLPYIGQVTLDTDEVMGRTLQVVYRIDIVTGMCAAIILVDQNVLYQFSGHCAINMPINSADFSGYIGAAMTAGKMVAGVVAGATGNLPLAAELIGGAAAHSSTTETFEKTTVRNPATGRQITSGTDTKIAVHKSPGASFGELTRKAVSNTVGSVMGSKLTVEHAGGFTGNSGYLAVRRPYLIIERPRMCNPAEYGKYNGRPSMIYINLGTCSGYTEVQSIQLNGIPATNPELSELSELLKSGVIL